MWMSNGTIVCVGAAELPALRCDSLQLQIALGVFVRELREHPWVGKFRDIVPIIEANNNSILSLSLLNVFKAYPPMRMPFLERHFARAIIDNVGVLTTEENKHAMLQFTLSALMDGRLFICSTLTTTGKTSYDKRAKKIAPCDTVELLNKELIAMRDLPDGKISGKMDSGQGDDLAMAFMMGLYWAHCCNALGV